MAESLSNRPRLSLRLQLMLGYLLVFLFAVIIAIAIIVSIHSVEDKVRSLEIVNDYVFEIDNARRYEKNYFLYGTDLQEAIDSVNLAQETLARSEQELTRILEPTEWASLLENIDRYEQSLLDLAEYDGAEGTAPGGVSLDDYEQQVRDQGHRMIRFARDVIERERHSIEANTRNAKKLQSYSLFFLLASMIVVAYVIGGNIVRSIIRFESYADRIAAGDFTPIVPARRFRDEFTDLGLAINHMMLALKRHEEMLVQTHKMRAIGTLTAGVAHELNNPLNNISLTAHMLLEDFSALDDDERKEMVDDVVQEAERAKKIVHNLLEFTRQNETEFELVDLNQLLNDTVKLAANHIKISKTRVEIDTEDEVPQILGDAQHLKQVFLNLILNAVHASDDGGKIRIRVQRTGNPDELSVKVIDHGKGIPKSLLPRVFEPFFTTKKQKEGTGLGLSVSHGIVRKHQGSIEVDSEEGKGTCVTVTLPAADRAASGENARE